jgi:hypothetical protein
MQAHRRQFVIGPEPVAPDETWASIAIGEGVHLSFQEALPVTQVRDREGADWSLLGIALQSDPNRPSPPDEIASVRSHEVDALTATWSGRWGLIGRGVLRPDACLFGCYYGRDPEGRLLASSSPALLRALLPGGDESPVLDAHIGMDWYPPPASRFSNIKRLLPSQVLAYTDAADPVAHRPLLSRPFEADYEDTLSFVETAFRTILRNVASLGRPTRLSLTGGHDTRVLLAAATRESFELTTFTWDIPGMSRADRVLPPLLARDAGASHRFIRRRRFDEEHLRMLDEHTALHTVDLDRELVPWGQYEELPAGAVVLLGNLFAIGAAYFYARLPARPTSVAASVAEAFGFGEHHAGSRAHREGMNEWADWIGSHPEPEMDWRDRFCWEQWGTGWAGAAEQGTEVVDVDCISPMNCEAIIAAVLGLDPARRYGKRWQIDLTYRLAPSLADHPYYLGGSLRTRFGWAASGLRHHPSKLRFVSGRTRSLAARTLRRPAP